MWHSACDVQAPCIFTELFFFFLENARAEAVQMLLLLPTNVAHTHTITPSLASQKSLDQQQVNFQIVEQHSKWAQLTFISAN